MGALMQHRVKSRVAQTSVLRETNDGTLGQAPAQLRASSRGNTAGQRYRNCGRKECVGGYLSAGPRGSASYLPCELELRVQEGGGILVYGKMRVGIRNTSGGAAFWTGRH